MPVIDGKLISRNLRESIKAQVQNLAVCPSLHVILIGNDEESLRYVRLKEKAAAEVGAHCQVHHLSSATTQEAIELVEKLNQDPAVHGILVQLPLPAEIDEDLVVATVKPSKDVDGLHPLNLGLSFFGRQEFTSCASRVILMLIDEHIPVTKPRVLMIGDSSDVVKPLGGILIGRGYPVTIVPEWMDGIDCSLYQVVILEKCEPQSFSREMFAAGTLVIDAGFHWLDGKTRGNAVTGTFENQDGTWLLPVPGGLGPLLITMLLDNLVKSVGGHG
ncbi:MAG: hypothetical protein GXY50_04615 [Syntrophomonadaceae bacterium]|nr:hypothetical protein [Syntrophomonadaceae bacterium]